MQHPLTQAAVRFFPGQAILYDPRMLANPDPEHFSTTYWREKDAVSGQALTGRQPPLYVLYQDLELVLRSFQHGGTFQSLTRDRFLWSGNKSSRAWQEWRLLALLTGKGLPVPRPVAALVSRRGLLYTAAILTLRIPGARPLSEHLPPCALDAGIWHQLGRLVARFHLAGADHADLNAHNILLDTHGKLWLVDFDKGRIRNPQHRGWQQANLKRLKRSLDKINVQRTGLALAPDLWLKILRGYHSARQEL